MIKIEEIIGNTMCCCSGGCHEGDFFKMLRFSDGSTIKIRCCTCGNGCFGTFPVNKVHEGMEFSNLDAFYQTFADVRSAIL